MSPVRLTPRALGFIAVCAVSTMFSPATALHAQGLSAAQQNDLYNKFFQMERRMQAMEQKMYSGSEASTATTSVADMELRLQEIENESTTLYGAVEQLGNAVERLAMRVESMAKDMELRLQDLEKAEMERQEMGYLQHHAAEKAATANPQAAKEQQDKIAAISANIPKAGEPAINVPDALAIPEGIAPEKLYKQAFDAVTSAQYPKAERWLEFFVKEHKDHDLADNAYYWLGEVYLVQGNARKAVIAFKQGLDNFPKGRKAPGNLLKMGAAFEQLGQKSYAQSAWKRVLSDFPNTPEAARARTMLGDAAPAPTPAPAEETQG